MARPGVTYLEVAKTATKLVEQKINPSIEEIRKVLGTGSNSTINKYLREWREKQGNQIELEKGLPESLLLAIRGIYDGIKDEATNKINNLENEYKIIVANLNEKLEKIESECVKLTQSNKLSENSIATYKEDILALQRQISDLKNTHSKKSDENNFLQERLEDKKQEIIVLNQQLKNLQDNLDHYRESIRQARETEINLFNDQINGLERQLYQQQTIANKITEEKTILLKQVKTLENDKSYTLKELNEALKNIQQQKSLIEQKDLINHELNSRYNLIRSEKNNLTKELNCKKESVIKLTISLEKSQERITMLKDSLNRAETKVVTISDQNLFLTQEKAELAFQLRQLQPCG